MCALNVMCWKQKIKMLHMARGLYIFLSHLFGELACLCHGLGVEVRVQLAGVSSPVMWVSGIKLKMIGLMIGLPTSQLAGVLTHSSRPRPSTGPCALGPAFITAVLWPR